MKKVKISLLVLILGFLLISCKKDPNSYYGYCHGSTGVYIVASQSYEREFYTPEGTKIEVQNYIDDFLEFRSGWNCTVKYK